jgi:hypothetical protein
MTYGEHRRPLLLTGRTTAVMDALHGPGVAALNA